MSDIKPFIIHPDPSRIKQHPTLLNQVRELSESYESHAISVDNKYLQQIGTLLWEILALDNALELAKEALNNNSILRIIIESDNGLVLSLPWETLHHPEYGFLAQHLEFTLTRRMPKVKKPLAEPEPTALRVLLFTSLPDNLTENERLQTEEEQAAVLQTLAEAEQQGRVILEMPDDGRFDTFKATLNEFKPHIVYLSGHGKIEHDYQHNKEWGVFEFEDQWGDRLAVIKDDLRDSLINSSVQAVVLSACQSAKQHKDYPDNGLAQCLYTAGIPHVIGMSESIYDVAGIAFAKAFFGALTQQLPIDQSLQQARIAIMSMPKMQNVDEHWCLPCQFSQNLNHPLIDWSFKAVPHRQTQTTKKSINGISLPSRFIGRRRELRQWQNALRRDEISELLIIGAAGIGKTTFAGKLLKSLEHDDYTIFALPCHALINNWSETLIKLESLLKNKYLIEQYKESVKRGEKTNLKALLDLLLIQYNNKFALLIDGLDNVQNNRTFKQSNINILIETARCFSEKGMKLLLTSRWYLPGWNKDLLCILGQPIFTDYLIFIRYLGLPDRFIINKTRVEKVFKELGGNYQAISYFFISEKNTTLLSSDSFSNELSSAKKDVFIYIAKIYNNINYDQKHVVNIMRAYLSPVDMMGICEISLLKPIYLKQLTSELLEASLLEQYWDKKKFKYLLSPLVRDWLKYNLTPELKTETKQKSALYLLKKLDYGIKKHPHIIPVVYTAIIKHEVKKYSLLDSNKKNKRSSSLFYLGQYSATIGNYEKAEYYYLLSLSIQKKPSKIIKFLMKLSEVHLYKKEPQRSIYYKKKALDVAEKKLMNKKIHNILCLISDDYININNLKSLKYARKSLDLAFKLKKDILIIRSLFSVILSGEKNSGKYADIGLSLIDKNLSSLINKSDTKGYYSMSGYIHLFSIIIPSEGRLIYGKKILIKYFKGLSKKNILSDFYKKLEASENILLAKIYTYKEIKYLKRSLIIYTKLGLGYDIDKCYLLICDAYINKGNYLGSIDYAKKSLQLNENFKNSKGIVNGIILTSSIYLKNDDFDIVIDGIEDINSYRKKILFNNSMKKKYVKLVKSVIEKLTGSLFNIRCRTKILLDMKVTLSLLIRIVNITNEKQLNEDYKDLVRNIIIACDYIADYTLAEKFICFYVNVFYLKNNSLPSDINNKKISEMYLLCFFKKTLQEKSYNNLYFDSIIYKKYKKYKKSLHVLMHLKKNKNMSSSFILDRITVCLLQSGNYKKSFKYFNRTNKENTTNSLKYSYSKVFDYIEHSDFSGGEIIIFLKKIINSKVVENICKYLAIKTLMIVYHSNNNNKLSLSYYDKGVCFLRKTSYKYVFDEVIYNMNDIDYSRCDISNYLNTLEIFYHEHAYKICHFIPNLNIKILNKIEVLCERCYIQNLTYNSKLKIHIINKISKYYIENNETDKALSFLKKSIDFSNVYFLNFDNIAINLMIDCHIKNSKHIKALKLLYNYFEKNKVLSVNCLEKISYINISAKDKNKYKKMALRLALRHVNLTKNKINKDIEINENEFEKIVNYGLSLNKVALLLRYNGEVSLPLKITGKSLDSIVISFNFPSVFYEENISKRRSDLIRRLFDNISNNYNNNHHDKYTKNMSNETIRQLEIIMGFAKFSKEWSDHINNLINKIKLDMSIRYN